MQQHLRAVGASESIVTCDAFDVLCQTALPMAGDRVREMFLTMAAGVLEWVAAWWAEVPTLSVTDGFGSRMRGYALSLSVAMLVLGLVVQAGRMVWMRRAGPLVDAVTGLSSYVLVVALAVPVAAGALAAGDAFAAGLLSATAQQQVASQVVAALAATPHTGVIVLLGLLASMAGVGLAAMMLLREFSVLILAATLPVAAAGRLVPGVGNWLPAVLRWVAALVLWKPAAAMVYAAGHRVMVPDEPRSLLVGVVTLGLTVLTLPALARWLTPVSQAASRGLLGGSGVSVAAGSQLVARGPSVQQQAARIERTFGSPAGRQLAPAGAAVSGTPALDTVAAVRAHGTNGPGSGPEEAQAPDEDDGGSRTDDGRAPLRSDGQRPEAIT